MIADLILLTIMILCIFLGYARGLIKVSVKLIGFIIALIVALVLYTPISNYIINNTEISKNLETTIQEKIYNGDTHKNQEETSNNNKDISKMLENYIEEYEDEIMTNGSHYIAQIISASIIKIGTWIGLFLAVRLLMIFIKIFADVIENIPVIKQFNKVRRNNIWYIRRIFNNIYSTCDNKYNRTDDKK